ncbi:hypothetical protein Slin15195_G095420 [Septoria linicola]|uniref:Uncharacterized protein n=1 Tax=Septoria linicola TaxID=215465 RepID=A0A9Q9EP71_9PEZI|nr:hypothetical protein Slin15195_G095420 [Septoria linicola]
MQLTLVALLSIASVALAGHPDTRKRDNDHPGGAAGIENAVTSLLSETQLPPDITTLGPALSSAGVTGVVVSDTTYGTSQPTGTGNSGFNQDGGQSSNGGSNGDDNNEQGSSGGNNNDENNNDANDDSRSRGLAAPSAVPHVLMAGAAGAVGMAVLGML